MDVSAPDIEAGVESGEEIGELRNHLRPCTSFNTYVGGRSWWDDDGGWRRKTSLRTNHASNLGCERPTCGYPRTASAVLGESIHGDMRIRKKI